MTTRIFIVALLLSTFVWEGCSIRRDITRNATEMTDFVLGHVYKTKQASSVLSGRLLTLKNVERPDSEGIVTAGTELVIRKIEFNDSFETGPYTRVFAEVLSGELQGRIVDLSIISTNTKEGYTKRDPEMLELVGGAAE